MRKHISLFAALILALVASTGCGSPAPTAAPATVTPAPNPSQALAPAAAPTIAPKPAPKPASIPLPAGVEWAGVYENDTAIVSVTNVNLGGDALNFSMETITGAALDGVLMPDGGQAEYMDLRFVMQADGSLSVTQFELRADSAERAKFVGDYPQASGDAPSASQSEEPFVLADIEGLLGDVTIEGAIDLLQPTAVSWDDMTEATGGTDMTFHCAGGTATFSVRVEDMDEKFQVAAENQKLSALRPGITEQEAVLSAAMWESEFFELPTVRGVSIGATEEEVLRAFYVGEIHGDTIYDVTALNPKADLSWYPEFEFVGARYYQAEWPDPDPLRTYGMQYAWASMEGKDDWRTYHYLTHWMNDGAVTSIELYTSTDPE